MDAGIAIEESPSHVERCPSCGARSYVSVGIQWFDVSIWVSMGKGEHADKFHKRIGRKNQTQLGAVMFNCMVCKTSFLDAPLMFSQT